MIDFLDFLNNLVLGGEDGSAGISAMDVMHKYAQQHLCFDLKPDEIVQSVQDASAFFNIDLPAEIHYGQMTGVCNHMADTMADDVLYISPEQMTEMHITAQDAFDLVMTHEGAHRALQGIDTHFNSHQEELCCDMLSGVRAGLNSEDLSMDAIEAMKASLRDTPESTSHPAGHLREKIIDQGVKFAQEYYAKHHCAPSLYECIDHFNELQGLQEANAVNEIHGLVTLRPDDAPEAVKAYSRQEIDSRLHKAQHDMDYWKSQWEDHLRLAKHDMWHESEMAHARSCQRKYEAAKQDYNHWKNEKPDDVKGYTDSDIDWLERQVRISSGSEQAHWLEKLNWATAHIHHYASSETAGSVGFSSDETATPPTETIGSVAFADATNNDSISDDTIHGFVNDKDWHQKEAKAAQESMEYHAKEMDKAAEKGDKSAMQSHKSKMEMAKSTMNDHLKSAQMCKPKGFADTVSFGSGFTEEQPMFTYDQLRDAGFSDHVANNMLNPDIPHSYSQEELHDVLYSDNPLEAYNRMMDAKAHTAINRADVLERQIGRDFGIFATI